MKSWRCWWIPDVVAQESGWKTYIEAAAGGLQAAPVGDSIAGGLKVLCLGASGLWLGLADPLFWWVLLEVSAEIFLGRYPVAFGSAAQGPSYTWHGFCHPRVRFLLWVVSWIQHSRLRARSYLAGCGRVVGWESRRACCVQACQWYAYPLRSPILCIPHKQTAVRQASWLFGCGTRGLGNHATSFHAVDQRRCALERVQAGDEAHLYVVPATDLSLATVDRAKRPWTYLLSIESA